MEKILKQKKGITLIALVITIIVLLILAGISISMLTGDNGILTRATQAKESTRRAEVLEVLSLEAIHNKKVEFSGGTKKTKADIVNKLHEEGKLTDEEVDLLLDEDNSVDVITIGGVTVDFSVLETTNSSNTLLAMFQKAKADKCTNSDGRCTKKDHLHIGDYVDYVPANTSATITIGKDGVYNGNTKNTSITGVGTGYDEMQTYVVDTKSQYKTYWRVLGLNDEETEILLISSALRKKGNDPYLYLSGAESYEYCVTTLNKICSIYDNSILASMIRSINIEDVNKLLGIDVTYKTNPNGSKTPSSVHEIASPSVNIDNYEDENLVESSDYIENEYTPAGWLNNKTPQSLPYKVYRTTYFYDENNLQSANQISKDLIFKDARSNANKKYYWLASPGREVNDEGYVVYGPGRIINGFASNGGAELFFQILILNQHLQLFVA